MPGGEKGESLDSSEDEDKRSGDSNRKSPPLFSVPAARGNENPTGKTRGFRVQQSPPLIRAPAAGSSGSLAENKREIARRGVTSGKEQKKRKK